MGVESFARDFENLGNVKVIPNTTNVVELNVPLTVDRAAIMGSTLNVTGATVLASTLNVTGLITASAGISGGVILGSRTKKVGGRVKVGGSAGWVVGAANDVGSMGTVAASQTAGTLVVYVEGLNHGDIITGLTVTASINCTTNNASLAAALHTYTVTAAATATDAAVSNGAISTITQTGTGAKAGTGTNATPCSSTVATGVEHFVLLTASTGASCTIELNTVEIIYTPEPGCLMPSIAIYDGFEFGDNDGSVMQDGSLDAPSLVTAEDPPSKYINTVNLAASTGKAILWDAANGPDGFNFLRIKSDTGDSANGWVMVELQTDETNAIGRQVFTIALAAGIPFTLCSSASYAGYTINFGGGTLSNIQKVTAKNLNTAAANVSLWLVD